MSPLQNLILNGPTIGHTSSLFPFIDNDDGSAYFSAVGNVGIYGGGKVSVCKPHHAATESSVQLTPERRVVGSVGSVRTTWGTTSTGRRT